MVKVSIEDTSIVNIKISNNIVLNGTTSYEWIGSYKNWNYIIIKVKEKLEYQTKKLMELSYYTSQKQKIIIFLFLDAKKKTIRSYIEKN